MATIAADSLGRYTLAAMRDRIRRLLDAYQISVNTSSGAETIVQIQDQSFSNDDIQVALNESLVGLYSEMITGKESLFATTDYMSVIQYNPGPYAFPPNMVQLRWLKWKDPNVAFNPTVSAGSAYSPVPVEWRTMQQCEDPNDIDLMVGASNQPTWRWESGQLLLNEVPQQANVNGIQINYIGLPAELTQDNQVISIPQFVRLAQQAAIYDTAYTLAFSKKKKASDDLKAKCDKWHDKLMVMVQNAYNNMSTQFIAPDRMINSNYTGRYRSNIGPRFE